MTPDKAELLNRIRRKIAEWQEHLEGFEEQGFRLLNGADEDISDVFVAQLKERIAGLEALVEKHDPEGFTVLR